MAKFDWQDKGNSCMRQLFEGETFRRRKIGMSLFSGRYKSITIAHARRYKCIDWETSANASLSRKLSYRFHNLNTISITVKVLYQYLYMEMSSYAAKWGWVSIVRTYVIRREDPRREIPFLCTRNVCKGDSTPKGYKMRRDWGKGDFEINNKMIYEIYLKRLGFSICFWTGNLGNSFTIARR